MSPNQLYGLYAALALGAAGLYITLANAGPKARRVRHAGAILAAAAFVALAIYMTRWIGREFNGRAFFIVFAAIAVAAAARVITHPRPVYSALYFVLVVLAVTGLCILAAAEFLGIALVIVYAGAILVTYIFVIMLAQQSGVADYDRYPREPLAAVAMGFAVLAAATQAMIAVDPMAAHIASAKLPYTFARAQSSESVRTTQIETRVPLTNPEAINGDRGNVRAIGEELLTTYVVSLEVAGVLLLVAMVGAIAIAQKRIEPAARTAEEVREQAAQPDLHQVGRYAPPF